MGEYFTTPLDFYLHKGCIHLLSLLEENTKRDKMRTNIPKYKCFEISNIIII